jgi:hypothetical protein
MRPPAGSVMLFEDENLFAGLCQCDGGSESARARTDNDYVIVCSHSRSPDNTKAKVVQLAPSLYI